MDRIRTSINVNFGELHAPGVGEVAELGEVLAHRADYVTGDLPEGVLGTALTVDVQRECLFVLLRGWGTYASSWLLAWGALHGDTAERQVWADLLDLMRTPLHGMLPKLVLIDAGFRPGSKEDLPTHRVYDFCRRFHNVKACRGSSWEMRTPIRRSTVEVDKRGGIAKAGVPILILDTNFFKDWVHEKLRWPMGEPGSWNLPRDIEEDYCQQLLSEKRERTSAGKVRWVRKSKENHCLDLEMMQGAAAMLLNAARAQEQTAAQPAPGPAPEVTESEEGEQPSEQPQEKAPYRPLDPSPNAAWRFRLPRAGDRPWLKPRRDWW